MRGVNDLFLKPTRQNVTILASRWNEQASGGENCNLENRSSSVEIIYLIKQYMKDGISISMENGKRDCFSQ
jgi:hypothetical protein